MKRTIKFWVIFFVYQVLQIVSIPFVLMYMVIRRMKGKSVLNGIKERLGAVRKQTKTEKSIWIHAASVGEVLSVQYLIDRLKKRYKTTSCYVTVGTTSGKKVAKQLNADYVSFLPYDFFIPMLMAFRRIKPKVIIIIEAEMWPNFLMGAYTRNIPLYLLNARLADRSVRKLSRIKWFFAFLFSLYKHIFTQSKRDSRAFETFGVPSKKISVFGNIKAFNVKEKRDALMQMLNMDPITYKKQLTNKILLVGSLHPGELDKYLQLFAHIKQRDTAINTAKMVLAPRHFHWKSLLCQKIKKAGYSFFMWDDETVMPNNPDEMFMALIRDILPQHDIVLVCTLGKLFQLYPLADIFFLGGTFVPIGGHNLLEPAVWGNPMIIGPFYDNCKVNADLLEQAGALRKARDYPDLVAHTNAILDDESVQKTMGSNAITWLGSHAQAVQMQLDTFFAALK